MRRRRAAVCEYVIVVASSPLQEPGQLRHPLESPLVVDALCKRDGRRCKARPVQVHWIKWVAEDVAKQVGMPFVSGFSGDDALRCRLLYVVDPVEVVLLVGE